LAPIVALWTLLFVSLAFLLTAALPLVSGAAAASAVVSPSAVPTADAYNYDGARQLSSAVHASAPAALAKAVGSRSSAAAAAEPRLEAATGFAAEDSGGAARLAGHSIRDVNPTGGTLNCVNCAVATDATLGGAPASALPGGVSDVGQLEQLYGDSFKAVGGQEDVEQMLSEAGPGSRGIVYGSRADTYGHVFNGVNQDGEIRFLDGQSGGVADWGDGFDSFYFLRTN
jgi:filamentous hemagglutinin